MSKNFSKLIQSSKRFSHDEFVKTFGEIDADVAAMLSSPNALEARMEARTHIDKNPQLLHRLPFGDFKSGPELAEGKVAAVDGATALPMQQYSIGQAICVAVGSVTYQRDIERTLHYWSAKADLDEAESTKSFLDREYGYLFGISQTAVLRYFEAQHGLEIEEPMVFFDGTIVYEWLAGMDEGTDLYTHLFGTKKCLGVMKNLHDNKRAGLLGWALEPGELFVIETLHQHLANSRASNKNHGEGRPHTSSAFSQNLAPKILRGVFKPQFKAFGFEVHEDHLQDMIRILAADCQMNYAGHEIPFLLNKVDEQLRRHYGGNILKNQIAYRMTKTDEEIFFENTDEHDFRR